LPPQRWVSPAPEQGGADKLAERVKAERGRGVLANLLMEEVLS